MCRITAAVATLPLVALALGACGDDGDSASASGGHPRVVVTTNVLGDVVSELVGDEADVEVIMPSGSDPHEFQPSVEQAAAIREADALIANGAGFEEGLTSSIEAAEEEGVPTLAAIDTVETLPLDGEVEQVLSAVPAGRRTLVTNHEVFGYLADRYGFDVVGAVIPSGTTQAEPSAAELDELAHTIEDRSVPAIFVETSSPTRLADALASEVGDVDVVELFTESLGPEGSGGETYAGMMRTNAERIAEALAS